MASVAGFCGEDFALDTAGGDREKLRNEQATVETAGLKTMAEGLEDLEKRVAGLIERYREARRQIASLEKRLREGGAERDALGRENDRLRAKVGELENELASRNSREEVVKNRLQQMLGQIDSLETEIARMEAQGHES